MKQQWDLVLHEKAVRMFISSRGAERRRLERALDALAADPYQKRDGEFKDRDGRTHFMVRCGGWALIYWLDEFVEEVRIVSLEKAHIAA
jgi:hypothetical protein